MEVTKESLLERYSNMETDELIELQQTSELTDMAATALDTVLLQRGVTSQEKAEIAEQIEHEVIEEFNLASIGSRVLAQTIDAAIALIILIVPLAIFGDLKFVPAVCVIAYIAYLLLQDSLPNGQSLGKRILGIAVINKTSKKACGIAASINRNGLLVFLGFIDLLFLGSRYRQRLGDMLANTVVIRLTVKD